MIYKIIITFKINKILNIYIKMNLQINDIYKKYNIIKQRLHRRTK